MISINRRNVLAATGAIVGSAALSACGGAPEETTEEETQQTADEEVAGGVMNAEESEDSNSSYNLVNPGILTIAVDPDRETFVEYNRDTEEYSGFDIDLCKAIASKLGLEVNFSEALLLVPGAGDSSIDDYDIGCSGLISPTEFPGVAFSEPYFTDDYHLIIRNSNDAISADNYTTALSASGTDICVELYTDADKLASEAYPSAVINTYYPTSVIMSVQSGSCEAGIMTGTATRLLSEFMEDSACHEIAILSSGNGYVIGFYHENPDLLADINDAIAELKADGTIDELATAWGIA